MTLDDEPGSKQRMVSILSKCLLYHNSEPCTQVPLSLMPRPWHKAENIQELELSS